MMKLVLAIVHDIDGNNVINALSRHGYQATKLASTGGFLKAGNTTLMIGTDEENVYEVIEIIKDKCEKRKQTIVNPTAVGGIESTIDPYPVEIDVGGATIFVLNVEQFEKA